MPDEKPLSSNPAHAPSGDAERRIQELERRIAQLEGNADRDRGSMSFLAFVGKVYASYIVIGFIVSVIVVAVASLR